MCVYFIISNLPIAILRWSGWIDNIPETGTFYRFVVGLNENSSGRWEQNFYNEYVSQDRNNLRKYEIEKIKYELLNSNLLKLFYKKTIIFWNSFENFWTLDYLNGESIMGTSITPLEFSNFIALFDKAIWIFILLCAVLSLKKVKTDELMLYNIFLLGAFIAYLFIEVQGRYGFVYRPFMFIIAAVGIEIVYNVINKIKNIKEGM